MRKYIFWLAMAIGSSAMADELADANKLLDAKSYPQAMAILTKLADGGNANAQLRLGQVYWYGEGVPVDRAKGDALFAKAAASGSADAKIALGLTAARQQHMGDIEHWTTKYDGSDLTSGQYNCKAPAVPEKSMTNAEIKATSSAVNDWKACYNGFVKNLGDAMPAGKRIPVEVSDLMTDQEMDQARAHLDDVYMRVAGDAKASADKTLASYDSWMKTTQAYVSQTNATSKAEMERLVKDNQLMQENMQRNYNPGGVIGTAHTGKL
jgi:TPR repeat protein